MQSLGRLVCRGTLSAMRHRVSPIVTVRSQSTFPIDDDVFAFSDEQKALRKMVFEYAQKRLAPLAAKLDREDSFSEMRTIWKELGSLGLLGVTAPTEYGGAAGTYLDHCIVMEEISRACAAIGLSYGAHSNLCVNQIVRNGNQAQKDRYLPKLISGEHIGALAMSETTSGSDVVSMRLRADQANDRPGWYLTGNKFWITNGPDADVLFVYAKTARGDPKKTKDALSAFLIERDFSGFSSGKKIAKMGMRGSNTGELVFDHCYVPKEQLVGELNRGVYVLMSGLDYERLVLAAGPLGIMQAACDMTFRYVHERKQFGAPLASFQLVQGKMADMLVRLQTARAFVYTVARALQAERKPADCAAAILYAGEMATQVALDAVQLLGGNGYTSDFPVERLVRDAKLYEIGAGTSEVRRIVIARNISSVYDLASAREPRSVAAESS